MYSSRLLQWALILGGFCFAQAASAQTAAESTKPEQPAKSNEDDPDAKGKFNAGVGARFPSGPDENGKFGAFHWIAVDAKGRYNPSDFVSTYINVPFAVKRPDLPAPLEEPSVFGGFTGRGELGFGKTLGVGATLGLMREGAFLLSEKDYPYYHGRLTFGTAVGPYVRFDMFGVYLSVLPQIVWQAGTGAAAQIPISAKIKLGSLLEVAADAGVFTGQKLHLSAADGGRIYAGASATAKLGPILLHLGSGVASLITDPNGMYPSIKESIYFAFDVKYAK